MKHFGHKLQKVWRRDGGKAVPSPAPSPTQGTLSSGITSQVAIASAEHQLTAASTAQESLTPAASHAEEIPDSIPPATDPRPRADFETGIGQVIPELSKSQKVWNVAYDNLVVKDEKLVRSYIEILSEYLENDTAENGMPKIDMSLILKDPVERQIYMKTLVENGRTKIEKTSAIATGVGDIIEYIQQAKGLIDAAIKDIPQAALPWAGVCVGLQILSNPGRTMKSNLTGITHVVSRMEWYSALAEHLLNKDNIVSANESALEILETAVITLYEALLMYQIKSVCYYQKGVLVFLRGLANWDDWDGDLKSVKDAEAVVESMSAQYHREYEKSSLYQLVSSGKEMQQLLGNIHQDLRDFIAHETEARMDDKQKECLRDLRVVDPRDDMNTIERKKDKLLAEACCWVFSRQEYAALTNWDESNPASPRLLWIKGHAGTGKTMLLIGIIRELENQSPLLIPNVSYFFFQGTGDKSKANATAALRSIMWLLLSRQPHLISHLLPKYENAGPEFFKDRNAFEAVSGVLKNLLKDPMFSPTYFIIDALDECNDGLVDLIEFISTTISKKVKWIVSSRPYVKMKNQSTEGSLVELDSSVLKDPVNDYIEYRLTTLMEKEGYDEDVLEKVSTVIRQRAQNTFLWVALVFKQLDVVEGWDAVEVIEGMPPQLWELYGHMMTRIEGGQMRDPEYCKNILVAVLLAYRPLLVAELIVLAGLPPKMSPQSVVNKCGSFLTISGGEVSLIHQSAQDYLHANYNTRLQNDGVSQGNIEIYRRSVGAMSDKRHGLAKNIYALKDFGLTTANMRSPSPDPLAHLRYSCLFWVEHLFAASFHNSISKQELSDDGPVWKFIDDHFLHWIESLSLLGRLSDGVQSMKKLSLMIKPGESPRLATFLRDAEKFLLGFGSIIERAPLQVYGSGLVFTETSSEVYKRQSTRKLQFIRVLKGNNRLHGCLQTLEGHVKAVLAVVFSPDGKTLASASDDKTVRLWDAATGAHIQTLQGHSDRVKAIAFSPDGKTLASASDDKTVRLWNGVTGAYIQTLRGHSDWVMAIAFSPDGKTLASVSDDKTVRLWDTAIGAYIQTLRGYRNTVRAIAFSPDGKTLALASNNKPVRLWDAATGAHIHTLRGYRNTVIAIAFSPDGKTLASASYGRTVRLWDAATGAHIQTLQGHSNTVIAIAFSPDGKTLASASYDETVRLWNTATGAHIQTVEGHSNRVMAIAFSPGGKTLALASADETIRLWDVPTGGYQQTLKNDSNTRTLSFSDDGNHLKTDSGSIRIPLLSDLPDTYNPQENPDYTIYVNGEWLTREGIPLLWLPIDYRGTCMAAYSDRVALAHRSGETIFLQFDFST